MIEAHGLTMHYGPVKALKEASFKVEQGQIVGLVGPNGAGKSTTMKILTTYLYPTKGEAHICGYSVLENPIEVRSRIGYLPEILPLYPNMEVSTYLDFVARARGLQGARLKERTEWVLDKCGLRPMYRKLIQELSKGYRQRTGLAQALIHDPEVVILDEPTSGLDPHQILEVRALIRELAEDKTVLLSTHVLQEVEVLADRIIIINHGEIVGDGTLTDLREEAQERERSRIGVDIEHKGVEKELEGIEGVERVVFIGKRNKYNLYEITAAPGKQVWQNLGSVAANNGWKLNELGEKPYTLEETFLALTERQNTKEGKGARA